MLDDPSGSPVELFQPAGRPPSPEVRGQVLLRSEDTGGSASVVELVVAAGGAGPPLHRHDFDELFHVLDGELVLQVGDARTTLAAGQPAFVPRGVPHALANPSAAPVRYLLVCTPAGFERHSARLAAQALQRCRRSSGSARPWSGHRRPRDLVRPPDGPRAIELELADLPVRRLR